MTSLRSWWSPDVAFACAAHLGDACSVLIKDGRLHLAAARCAVDERLFLPAATLYGHAITSFARARAMSAVSEDEAQSPAMPSPVAAPAIGDLVSAELTGSPERRDDVLRLLDGPPIEGVKSGRRVRLALTELDRIARTLGGGLYPATDREVRSLRLRRRLGTAVVLVAALVAVVQYVKAPRNVARGKAVTASSVRLGSPQALVNGAIEWGTFGLHTGSGREWATINLGAFYPLAFAEIYGRGDGRFEFNLPLTVELSDDGVVFRRAGGCTEIFTQASPCVVDLHGNRAQFVRVVANEVVLSEVEVYAKP